LCRSDERLCDVHHVIADSPRDAAGYLGPQEFATRLRRVLAPLLEREQERLVICGLSRGAMAALDLGADLASTRGMRVGVLAMAPPAARPQRAPHTVLNIGGFEPIIENFVPYLELHRWFQPIGAFITRDLYVRFGGFTLAELRMANAAAVELFARYVRQSDPTLACLRSVREFALLGRVSDAELRHAVSMSMQRYAFSESAHVTVCWGDEDAWLDVPACRERIEAMIARHAVPSERIEVHTLRGSSHGVSREPDQDFTPIAAWLVRACEHARAGGPEQDRAWKVESA
jgi:pimeloyl-ACP methyl ester carboxylesterase